MKKSKNKIFSACVFLFLIQCSGLINPAECETENDSRSYCFTKVPINVEQIGEEITSNLFIGESFENNLVYIEPFEFDSHDHDEEFKFINIRKQMTAFAFQKSNSQKIHGKFIEHTKMHLPNIYDRPKYFSMTISEPVFDLLKYRVAEKTENNSIIFELFDIEFENGDCSIYGKKRPYTKLEYKNVLNEIEEDRKNVDRTLDFRSLDETILNARYICKIQDTKTKIVIFLSVYETKGMEYAGTVYVADLYRNKKFVKTIEKYNYDGPY